MPEYLYAPQIDLVELDACVSRLSQAARLIESAPPPSLNSVSMNGTASARFKEEHPNLPLLHSRNILTGRVGSMEASVAWSLAISDAGPKAAVAILEVSCPPFLGKVTIVEQVRTDLSNAADPADNNAPKVILQSVLRLRDLVRSQANALRSAMANGDPRQEVITHSWSAAMAAAAYVTKAVQEAPDDLYLDRYRLATGAPYQMCKVTAEDPIDHIRGGILSQPALSALQNELPAMVELEIEHISGGVRYRFAPASLQVNELPTSDDPVERLRLEQRLSTIPSPAWDGKLFTED